MFTDTTTKATQATKATAVAYLLPETQIDGTAGARLFEIVRDTQDGPILRDPVNGGTDSPTAGELAQGIPLDARAVALVEAHGRTIASDALHAALERINGDAG